MTDYTMARYYALSSIGYGKGFSPEEAVENYVKTQLRNVPARQTVFETKPKWEAALRDGEAKAKVWHAPEGTTGFHYGFNGLTWVLENDEQVAAQESELVN